MKQPDSDLLAELLAEVEALRAEVRALTTPRHGERTILGENVRIDPACTLISRENATIRIGDHTQVWRGGEWTGPVTVGKRVFVNQGSYIRPLVTIEDDVSLGPFVRLITDSHDISSGSRRTGTPRKDPILVRHGAWIGAGATVMGGVTIGARSIVAVGAVVNRDVPDDVVVAGVPARIVRRIVDREQGAVANLAAYPANQAEHLS
ncbi:hypothetical protein GCM10009592_13440 [Brachybacterium rhamnosum]|uniref:Acyltransferase n=1 Tax=Brachybacterium rhamnosum TaxID=173361 RepID=A0ABW4PVU2_9MICO